jgi:hypothetical protein
MKPVKFHHVQTVGLYNGEDLYATDIETGDMRKIKKYANNIPSGKSLLDYKNFGMLNMDVTKKLEKYFSNLELSIIFKLINRVEFNSNSLKPLNDDTSIRLLAEEFNISINTVPKIFKNLKEMGVFAQLDISENKESKKYWILNPYIFWRGKLKDDSLFVAFNNTDITKLLK